MAYAGFALLLTIRHYAIHLHLYAMGVKGCGRKRQTTGRSEVEGVRPSSLGSDGDGGSGGSADASGRKIIEEIR